MAEAKHIVVVMAGGLGKRLYPLTAACPKPLLKIANKPVLEILLESFLQYGFKDFYFAVNYKLDMIKNYFQDGSKWGGNIIYLEENKRLGTAGALSLLPKIPEQAFFVVNADIITTINFKTLMLNHQQVMADATICLIQKTQTTPYGVVKRSCDTHRLLDIAEKPTEKFFINAGIYILEPKMISLLGEKIAINMPDLLLQGMHLEYHIHTCVMPGYWQDIGRHEDLIKASIQYEKT